VKSFCFVSIGASVSLALLSHWVAPTIAMARPSPMEGAQANNPLERIAQLSPIAQNAPVLQAVDIDLNSGWLVIRTSQPALYNTGWERATGAYRVSVAAQPTGALRLPPTGASSPLLRIEVRQDSAETTTLLLFPASGVQVGQLQTLGPGVVALPLSRNNTALMPPSDSGIPLPVPNNPIPNNPTIRQPPPIRPLPLPSPRPLPIPPRPRVAIGSRLVVLDPGHGGPDPGAVGIGGIQEKDIVLDVSLQVARILQTQGIQVILTRQNDIDLGLEPRTRFANEAGATAFVSIHANAISLSRPEINGVETFHYLDSSQPLAASIQNSILDSMNMNSRGVKRARFYVLRYTRMPSALVEIGFVTGEQDAPRLADPSFRAGMAQAIARGIMRYLGTEP
jgi:N-acetylmuramoyl-L-alanine amidase